MVQAHDARFVGICERQQLLFQAPDMMSPCFDKIRNLNKVAPFLEGQQFETLPLKSYFPPPPFNTFCPSTRRSARGLSSPSELSGFFVWANGKQHVTYPLQLPPLRSLSDDWVIRIVTLEPLQFVRRGRSPYESTIAMDGMLTHGEAHLGPSGT